MTMKRRPFATALSAAALLLSLIACGVEKSKSPLSPSVAGPIAGVEITAPRLLQPGDGTKLKATQQPITLMVENSSSNGVRPVTYSFEVAADPAFENKVYARSGVQPGEGHTTLTVGALDSGRQYFWRVRAEDGANASGYSTAGFEVLPKPQLDPPPQVSPLNNELTGSRRPALVVGASARNAAIGNLTYEFQIAGDPAFASLVAIGISGESGDRTAWTPGADLNGSTTYFWRVRAIDTDLTSAWSGTQSFRTASAPSPSPGPSPGPAPGPAPGGPCNSGDPLKIVECERAKFGNMNDSQLVSFLAAVADSLNRNGISGGRFGLLVKTSGSNCNGYSCDIICSGNGGGQRQWDVVAGNDAQTAMWHEVDGIAVRPCEIR
jgi:hypothetical protein